VAHSKGGLDARGYLAMGTDKVAIGSNTKSNTRELYMDFSTWGEVQIVLYLSKTLSNTVLLNSICYSIWIVSYTYCQHNLPDKIKFHYSRIKGFFPYETLFYILFLRIIE